MSTPLYHSTFAFLLASLMTVPLLHEIDGRIFIAVYASLIIELVSVWERPRKVIHSGYGLLIPLPLVPMCTLDLAFLFPILGVISHILLDCLTWEEVFLLDRRGMLVTFRGGHRVGRILERCSIPFSILVLIAIP